MSKIEINLAVTFNIPDEGMNVNGLLFGLKKASSQIMLCIAKTLFHAIEQKAVLKIQKTQKTSIIRYGRCRSRTLKTSFGSLTYRFQKLKNTETNQILIPLREMLNIPKYRQYQDESMEPAIGLAAHLSYGRSGKEANRIRGTTASRWTVWRRLQEFSDAQCQFPDFKKVPYRFLLVDGTGVHLQGSRGQDIGQKRMRWALASKDVNQPFDIVGIWVNTAWKAIARDLTNRLDYKKVEVLLSDGGQGIQENLMDEGMRHQRCIFHGKRDFSFLLYADGLKKKEQQPFIEFFKQIPAVSFIQSDMKKVSPDDRLYIHELCKRTEMSFQLLIDALDEKNYPKSKNYIENLAKHASTFFDWWLERSVWIPNTSNLIENRFSQIKNRIKRIGKRWSDQGLQKWLMVVIQKIFTPENWDQLWNQFLEIIKPVELIKINVSYKWI
jgi:hypothetical protein